MTQRRIHHSAEAAVLTPQLDLYMSTYLTDTIRSFRTQVKQIFRFGLEPYNLQANEIVTMAAELPHPRVGVAAVIFGPDGKLVAGKRKGSHGAGETLNPRYIDQLI